MTDKTPKRINAVVIPRNDPETFPGRNTYVLFGRPIIAWVLDALKHTRFVTGVFVSTNDEALAAVARDSGCQVIPRPEALDDDRAARVEILRHVVTWLYREQNTPTDIALAVRASIPELKSSEVDNGIEFLERNKLREVLSVGANCQQNDDIRIIRNRALFSTLLSNRIGVMKTEHVDVHSLDDIAALQARYVNRERFDAVRE